MVRRVQGLYLINYYVLKLLMYMEIIAEIGQNHNGDMVLAKELICAAKESGADVAKFQLFDAVKTFGKDNNPWFDYNCKTQLSQEKLMTLFDECKKVDIEFMSSVFNIELIDWLEKLNVKRYKIASRSIYDEALISRLLEINKPLIISLGYWKEKQFPVFLSKSEIKYLYCISKYPTELKELNLLEVDFTKYGGFSDHTLGINAAIIALSRGATIIEKHFTLDKNLYGPDHSCSMLPEELLAISNFKKELKLAL